MVFRSNPLLFSEFRTISPHTAAGQTIVFFSDALRELKLRQTLQDICGGEILKLRSPRIPDQNFGPLTSDAVVQPAVEAGSEGVVVEHVPQEDNLEVFRF